MTIIANKSKALALPENITDNDEYIAPISISDIISICREYHKLGWQIQNQVEIILDIGVEDAIKQGYVKREALPLIKDFLSKIGDNVYFGDAVMQSNDCIGVIQRYEDKYRIVYGSSSN